MKMIKTTIALFAMVLVSGNAIAQQLPLSNLYATNPYSLNPAYAGYNGAIEGYISHLIQWVDIPGAPETSYLGVNAGVGDKIGVGGNILYDKTDMVTSFVGNGTFSYRLQLNGENHNLRLGLNAGVYQVVIDPTQASVNDVSDPILMNGIQSGLTLSSSFGVFYNNKSFQLGVSVPQIYEAAAEFGSANTSFVSKRHFVVYSAYKIVPKTGDITYAPSFMFKTISAHVNQFDVNFDATYKNMVTLGLGYRSHIGMVGRVSLLLNEMFVVAYAYEFPGSNISAYGTGSHEILIGVKMGGGDSKDKKNSSMSID